MKHLGEYVENNVLILGGSGLIGSNISYGTKVSSNDVNLLDYDSTLECFKRHMPDIIINAAAKTVSSKLLYASPSQYIDENIRISLNVYRAANEINVKRLITFASINAFLGQEDQLSADAYNHRLKQVLSDVYAKEFDLSSKTIFLGNIYGPNSTIHNGAIPTIIDKCWTAKINNTDLILEGNENVCREFTYVDDIAFLTEQFIHDRSCDPIIISSGLVHTLGDVVNIITRQIGFNGKVIWKGEYDRINNKRFITNDVETLKSSISFTPLEDGITKTIESYVSRYL